jgi:hypothetical protein
VALYATAPAPSPAPSTTPPPTDTVIGSDSATDDGFGLVAALGLLTATIVGLLGGLRLATRRVER